MVRKLDNTAASIADLKWLTKKRIPQFAYEYLVGGCNNDRAVSHNRDALDYVFLQPSYLARTQAASLKTTALGVQYDAPFGIAPLGLSGLIWPKAAEYHASAAKKANIPYILSTLASTSIEDAAACAGNNLWFQLYPPKDTEIRLDLMRRAQQVGCNNLVVTIDVPVAGRRPNDIKNGLSVPPKITANSIYQTLLRPSWALATAFNGMPEFANMQPYMNKLSNLQDVANYIRSTLKEPVSIAILEQLRQQWPGKLIVKGVLSVADAKLAAAINADAIIVSNHGGRQLDLACSPVEMMREIVDSVGDKLEIYVDSGVESGVDIARYLALGAKMVFSGRPYMYGVGAFGERGADHCIDIFYSELEQVMNQLGCSSPHELVRFLK
jgi:isopentenyl diphosphate isomerase/L-lactate dehydrogenase-like FMN-dependent dehydrogenase